MKKTSYLAVLLCLAVSVSCFSGEKVSFKAPEWEGVTWSNLPDDKTTLEVRDYKDKVVVLFCFKCF